MIRFGLTFFSIFFGFAARRLAGLRRGAARRLCCPRGLAALVPSSPLGRRFFSANSGRRLPAVAFPQGGPLRRPILAVALCGGRLVPSSVTEPPNLSLRPDEASQTRTSRKVWIQRTMNKTSFIRQGRKTGRTNRCREHQLASPNPNNKELHFVSKHVPVKRHHRHLPCSITKRKRDVRHKNSLPKTLRGEGVFICGFPGHKRLTNEQ